MKFSDGVVLLVFKKIAFTGLVSRLFFWTLGHCIARYFEQ